MRWITMKDTVLFQWLYLTGIRAGEALALSKEDITITDESAIAVVNGTMQYRGRKTSEQTKSEHTKTAAGMREVNLSKKCVDVYYRAVELNDKLDSPFLFTTSKGTPIQITAINTYLKWQKELLDIDKQVSSHIFRHTHISKLAEIGTPLYATQDRVGHENSQITESMYLHVTKGVKAKLENDVELLQILAP